MGIELDVLVGHPEHDLLFVATQVARAAGLKNPHMSATKYRHLKVNAGRKFLTVSAIVDAYTESRDLQESIAGNRKALQDSTMLFVEADVYQILMRGSAPQSEPFRKWVTEEVLPTIRKTGKYDAEQSTNPIAMGLMDELKALRGASVREKQGARWVLALENSRRDAAV
ncbi:Bro-N domain-containing protein [Pseudomonas mandelii]|uniref:BRO-N domain-containing protein n=1 Tax=Pseudomonas mandelii TaxID=75612 RepID=UPI00224B4540|nr:BRO family protein [Pseudomonas mandelii]MCX2898310.1 BRO family protein [Pseudomonas mandelii]